MVVKLFGVADLLTAIVILLMHYDIFSSWRIGLIFVGYLVIKGLMFRSDFNSIIDIMCGIYMFVMLFGFTSIVTWAVVIYIFQKAIFSLAG